MVYGDQGLIMDFLNCVMTQEQWRWLKQDGWLCWDTSV